MIDLDAYLSVVARAAVVVAHTTFVPITVDQARVWLSLRLGSFDLENSRLLPLPAAELDSDKVVECTSTCSLV